MGHAGTRRLHLRVPPRPGARGRRRRRGVRGPRRRSSATGSSPASCVATTSSCSAARWCATCCPSVVTDSRCPRCSTSSRTTACVAGAASPDHWVHVSPGGGGGSMCPAIEPQETGLTEPWPPQSRQDREQGRRGQCRRGRHRLAPARRDRPPHPVAQGREGRRRAQRPRPATVRRPRHLHRRCRAVRRPRDEDLRRGLRRSAASVAAGSWSPTSSCSSSRRCGTTRRSSTSRPAAAPAATGRRSR